MAKWGENDSNAPDAAGGGVEPEFGSAEWLLAQLNGGREPSETPRSPLLAPPASAAPVAPVQPAAPITPAAPATPVTPIVPVAAAPYEHARPVFPAAPAAPVAPVAAQPAAPVQPVAPVAPVQPVSPIAAQPPANAAPQPVRPLLPPSPAPAYDSAENFARPRSVQPDFFEAAPTAVLPQVPPQAAAPAPAAPAPAVPFTPAPTYIPPTAQQPVAQPVEQPARSAQPARPSQPPVDQSFTAAFLSPAEELASMFADDDDEADYKGGANNAQAAAERGAAAGVVGAAAASASKPEAPAFQWGLVAGDEAPQTNAAPVPPVASPAPAPAAPAPAAPVAPVAPLAPTAAVSNAASSDEASDDVLADWLAASMPAASGSDLRQGDASNPPTLVVPPAPHENPLAIPSVSSVLKPPAQPLQPPAPASAAGSGQPQPYTPGAAFAPTFGGPAAQQSASNASPFGGMSASSNSSVAGGSGSGSGSNGSGSGSGSGSNGAGKKPRGLMIALAAVAAVAVLGGLFALGTALPSLFGGDSTAGSGSTSSETAGESATPVELPPAPVPEAMQPPGEHAWDTLYGGECIDPFTSPWTETFTVVDCAAPHAAQLVYRGTFGGEESTLFPGEEALSSQINALCGAPGIVDLAAAAGLGDLQLQGSYPVTEAQWASGQHSYFCFVTQASGEPITGSIAGTGPAV